MFIEIESCVFEIGRTIRDYLKKIRPWSASILNFNFFRKGEKWLARAEDYPERN